MKKEEIFEAMGNIDDEFIEDAAAARPHKSKLILKYCAAAACFLIIAAGSIVLWQGFGKNAFKQKNEGDTENTTIADNDDIEYIAKEENATDNSSTTITTAPNGTSSSNTINTITTAPNGGNSMCQAVPWERLIAPLKFGAIPLNGATYYAYSLSVDSKYIGDFITDVTLNAKDEKGVTHTTAAKLYKMKNISSDFAVAVEYADEKIYYKATNTGFNAKTLGELINALDLTENLPSLLQANETVIKSGKGADIQVDTEYSGIKREVILEKLLDKSAKSVPDYVEKGGYSANLVIELYFKAEALGSDMQIYLFDNGHININLAYYNVYFYVGKDKVNDFTGYVRRTAKKTVTEHKINTDTSTPPVVNSGNTASGSTASYTVQYNVETGETTRTEVTSSSGGAGADTTASYAGNRQYN